MRRKIIIAVATMVLIAAVEIPILLWLGKEGQNDVGQWFHDTFPWWVKDAAWIYAYCIALPIFVVFSIRKGRRAWRRLKSRQPKGGTT